MAGSSEKIIDIAGKMVEANLQLSDFLILVPVIVPMMFGALALMLRARTDWQGRLAMLALALSLLGSFGLLQRVLETGPYTMTMGRWLPPFGISFTVDLVGALFVLVGSIVAIVGALYSLGESNEVERRYGFYPFYLLMIAGVNGAFLTGDIFNLYVWFEVLLISSFGMIVLGSEKVQLDGTLKYAFLNLVATTMFLTATGYLYGVLGTLNMADIYSKVRLDGVDGPIITISVLYLLAFSMKAAAFPMNFWLPASYHTPKIVVSAVFAGLLTKVGIYALLRVNLMLFGEQRDLLASGIAWLAALTMLVGVMGALAQSDIRRLLGYLVISGIGTMLAGFAIASQTAVTGVMMYAMHSMLVMTALYLAAGIISRMTGSFDLRRLGGVYSASPMLAIAFLILALSVSGLPPTSGFWSKFILVKAALEVGSWWLAAIILISGFLTTIAIFRVWIFAFWRGGPEGTRDGAESWHMIPLAQDFRLQASLALGVLALATLAIGFSPQLLINTSADAATGLLFPQAYINSVFGGVGK